MKMNLKQLKYVIVLSETGSFSKAAEILKISQPSLSQYIKNIEKQIGAELFIRSNGEIRLTDAGLIYLESGKKILDIEHQMGKRISDLSDYKGGSLIIGISPYRSVHMMPEALRQFNELYPNTKLVIKERSGNSLLDGAVRGEYDLCVIALPVDEMQFDYEIVLREEMVIAVNEESPLCRKLSENMTLTDNRKYPAVDISLINGEDFAVLNEYMTMRRVTEKVLNEYSITINEKIELSSNEAMLSIVKSGVCASLIPSGLTEKKEDYVKFFSIKQDTISRDIAVIYQKQQYISEPMRDFIRILKKSF